MKKLYFKLLLLVLVVLSTFSMVNAQCIPTGVRPIFGTVTGSTGTQTFTNVPTGNVVRITAPAAGVFYTISMCSTNGGVPQADGIDDSQLTIIDVNSAAAVDLAFNDDFCPTTGPNGYGPSQVTYTSTAAGDIFVYLTEWDATGANDCIANGANTYIMTVTKSAPPACEAGTLTSPLTQNACPGDLGTIASSGASTPGSFVVGFSDASGGTGGAPGGFNITGVTLPYTFDEDLNGVLSANSLPVLSGTWLLTLYAVDGAGVPCDSTPVTTINFLPATNPLCGGTGFDASVDFAFISEYTGVPLAQAGSYFPSCDITNTGSGTVTGVSVATTIYDGSGTSVYTTNLMQASLAAGITTTLTAGTAFTPSAVDFYLVEFIVSINEVDGEPLNDTLLTAIDITDSLYVRDFAYLTGNVDGAVGVGAGSTMEFGNVFDVVNATTLVSVDAFFNGTLVIGDVINARVYNFAANAVGSQVALLSKTITVLDTPVGLLTFDFNQSLAPGQYFIAIEETAPVDNMGILYTNEVYTTDRIIANIDGGAFDDVETLTGGAFRIVPLVRANLYTPPVLGDCADLIISEVVEGSGSNKCLEFYNPTTSPIDLAAGAYAIKIYTNGAATATTTTALTGTVPAEGTFVLCNSASNATFLGLADLSGTGTNNAVNYNGNDAIELVKGSTTLDIVGQIGNAANFNLNTTLVRKVDILVGDIDGSNAFAAATEWTAFPSDNSSHLRNHYSDCNPVCYFDSIVISSQTACNPATNTFSQTVILYYNNPPASGTISVNGQTFALGTSPQTVTLTGLTSGSGNFDILAFFSADPTCELSINNAFVSPASCLCVPFTLSATTVPAVCTQTGSINLTVGGGTGAYSYSWSPGGAVTQDISGLTAGSYTVLVTDAQSCDTSFTVNVANNSYTLGVNVTTTPVSNCVSPNGSATAAVTGSTGSLTYAWTPSSFGSGASISNIPSGSYSVMVTDGNGCTGTGSASVSNSSGVNASVSTLSNVSCNSGSNGVIGITATGGTAPITYTWSDQGFPSGISSRNNLSAGAYTITVADNSGCSVVLGPITLTQPNALVVSLASANNATCSSLNNGSIDMNVSGGTPNYSYSWSNSSSTSQDLTGLGAGTYQLTVTDGNSCPSVQGPAVTITQPSALTVSVSSGSVNNVTCNGGNNGSFTAVASGGTAPYTYTVGATTNNTGIFSGLTASNYTVSVSDANSCPVAIATQAITQPAVVVASVTGASVNNPSCTGVSNGGFTVTATGGTAPYTYTVGATSNSTGVFSNLGAGNYTITVVDANSCLAAQISQTLTAPTVAVSAAGSTAVTCFGLADGTISMNVIGGQTPYTYSWTNTAATTEDLTGLSAGSYTLTATDANGCSGTGAAVVVADAVAISTSISSTPASTATSADGTATVIAGGGAGAFTYSWNDANGQTTSTAIGLTTGNYTVEITDGNGCSAIDDIFVDFGSAINELSLNDLNVYPNPADRNIVVSFSLNDTKDVRITFYSTLGNIITSEEVNVTSLYSKTYDVSSLSAGVYFIEISGEEGKVVKRFTINR